MFGQPFAEDVQEVIQHQLPVSPNHIAPPSLCQVPPVCRAPIPAVLLVYTVDQDATVFVTTFAVDVTISMTLDALVARTRTMGSLTYPHELRVRLVSEDVPAPLHKDPPLEISVHPRPRGAVGSIIQYTENWFPFAAKIKYCPLVHDVQLLAMARQEDRRTHWPEYPEGDDVFSVMLPGFPGRHEQPSSKLAPTLGGGHGR
jgi:hypothetical protein